MHGKVKHLLKHENKKFTKKKKKRKKYAIIMQYFWMADDTEKNKINK